jgi:hypothetical protein
VVNVDQAILGTADFGPEKCWKRWGFWERTEGFHQETWGFTSPISWDVSNDHEDSAIKNCHFTNGNVDFIIKVRTSPRLIQQQ